VVAAREQPRAVSAQRSATSSTTHSILSSRRTSLQMEHGSEVSTLPQVEQGRKPLCDVLSAEARARARSGAASSGCSTARPG
jgi:hypothetical protein